VGVSKLGFVSWLFVGLFAAFAHVTLFKLLPETTRRGGLLASELNGSVNPERGQAKRRSFR
jgi:hypothetical protein